jgi:hypothetical protein
VIGQRKSDQEFLLVKETEISLRIKKSVHRILRFSYKNASSAIKRIHGQTSIHQRAIRNWYEGRNPPSATHLIILARSYPAVFHELLRVMGHGYLTNHVLEKNVPLNVPDEFSPDVLNDRQKWILLKLALRHKIMVRDVARIWSVTDRTAKRDLADLKLRGYIDFQGSRKKGRYLLTEHKHAARF